MSATARAGTGVVAVEFQVDGVAVGEDANAPYAINIDSDRWASGQHVLRARGRDAASNRSAWAAATVRFTGGGGAPAGFTKDDNWVDGLNAATAMAAAPDGRLFVAEQGGTLRVVKGGALLATPFHTLAAVDTEGERGLIGVALHPNFAANGHVFVYHTRLNGSARNNRITRLTASAPSSDVSTGLELPLVDLPNLSSASNHNGGALKFGTDGKLYVGVGDNSDRSKPQNLADPFGKLLRFNDDGGIPTDNPFYRSQSGLARSVWAYGLRNPYTFAIQPGSGRMHINDVGQETWEEINLGASGANYGWPTSEGPANVTGGVTGPLFAYAHVDTNPAGSGPGGFFIGEAITGGAFYPANGPFPAAYRGNYFFADFLGRFVGMLDLANGNAAYSFGRVAGLPVDMAVGSDGALHVLTRDGIARFSYP